VQILELEARLRTHGDPLSMHPLFENSGMGARDLYIQRHGSVASSASPSEYDSVRGVPAGPLLPPAQPTGVTTDNLMGPPNSFPGLRPRTPSPDSFGVSLGELQLYLSLRGHTGGGPHM
jgi:hypothetical protein